MENVFVSYRTNVITSSELDSFLPLKKWAKGKKDTVSVRDALRSESGSVSSLVLEGEEGTILLKGERKVVFVWFLRGEDVFVKMTKCKGGEERWHVPFSTCVEDESVLMPDSPHMNMEETDEHYLLFSKRVEEEDSSEEDVRFMSADDPLARKDGKVLLFLEAGRRIGLFSEEVDVD